MFYEDEKDMYRDALLVQNACNISGVTRSLSDALSYMTRELNLDEQAKRSHPVVRAFIYKIMDMMDIPADSDYLYSSLGECEKWLRGNGHIPPNY